jgi:predicted ATP-binding protein involved in virulence
MRIDAIRLKDFRQFDDCEFKFSSKFNVLIGDNGSGKTTILEALVVGINSYIAVVEGRNVRPIRKDDIRYVSFEHSVEMKLETAISLTGYINKKQITWSIGKPYKNWGFMKMNDSDVKHLARGYMEALSENGGENIILPLFNYLGSGRLWTESTEKVKAFPKGSRLEGYRNCLSSKGSFKRFIEWFRTMELSALQDNEPARLKAQLIKRTVSKFMEGWESIYYSFEDEMLMATRGNLKNRQNLPFSYLSDGQRNIIGIVADIAYRCALLNPKFGLDAASMTPGVVLIDELDLHLHPNWQKSIVHKLKEAFPNVQFITTTHSPFIVQSLESEELINLDKITDVQPKDLSLEEVSENIMGVDGPYATENEDMEKLSAEYLQLLNSSKTVKVSSDIVSAKLDEFETKVSDPAVRAFLKMKRLESETKGDVQ